MADDYVVCENCLSPTPGVDAVDGRVYCEDCFSKFYVTPTKRVFPKSTGTVDNLTGPIENKTSSWLAWLITQFVGKKNFPALQNRGVAESDPVQVQQLSSEDVSNLRRASTPASLRTDIPQDSRSTALQSDRALDHPVKPGPTFGEPIVAPPLKLERHTVVHRGKVMRFDGYLLADVVHPGLNPLWWRERVLPGRYTVVKAYMTTSGRFVLTSRICHVEGERGPSVAFAFSKDGLRSFLRQPGLYATPRQSDAWNRLRRAVRGLP